MRLHIHRRDFGLFVPGAPRDCFVKLFHQISTFPLSSSSLQQLSLTLSDTLQVLPPTTPSPVSSSSRRRLFIPQVSLYFPSSSPTLPWLYASHTRLNTPQIKINMFRLSLVSAIALLSIPSVYASVVSTSVFPNSACAGSSNLKGLVGVGRVTLANGQVETHCGCPSVSRSLSLPFLFFSRVASEECWLNQNN